VTKYLILLSAHPTLKRGRGKVKNYTTPAPGIGAPSWMGSWDGEPSVLVQGCQEPAYLRSDRKFPGCSWLFQSPGAKQMQ